jgi:hypothetical protein
MNTPRKSSGTPEKVSEMKKYPLSSQTKKDIIDQLKIIFRTHGINKKQLKQISSYHSESDMDSLSQGISKESFKNYVFI